MSKLEGRARKRGLFLFGVLSGFLSLHRKLWLVSAGGGETLSSTGCDRRIA
jgi:hypothetical protein